MISEQMSSARLHILDSPRIYLNVQACSHRDPTMPTTSTVIVMDRPSTVSGDQTTGASSSIVHNPFGPRIREALKKIDHGLPPGRMQPMSLVSGPSVSILVALWCVHFRHNIARSMTHAWIATELRKRRRVWLYVLA